MPNTTSNGSEAPASEVDSIDRLEHALREWRTRLDDLKVQLDLGAMEAKDKLTKKLQVAQNAYLAARSSLSHAQESGSDLAAVREDVMRVLRDVKAAYDAVNEVVRRSRTE
jgi:predicted  nucleic acid-binding Zn-ribbon protein